MRMQLGGRNFASALKRPMEDTRFRMPDLKMHKLGDPKVTDAYCFTY
jgi:hypothetical protein